MGMPAPSKPATEEHWVAKAILLGLVSLVIYEIASGWISERAFIAVVLTISLVWAIHSTFRPQWSRKRFRVAVLLLLALHVAFLFAVLSRVSPVEWPFLRTIVIPEGIAVFVLLGWLSGMKYFNEK
jgi:hypothetical protein